MTAILGGLGAAMCWALSALCASRSTRLIQPAAVLTWIAVVGLLVCGPIVAVQGIPGELDATALGWLALSGAGNITGLLLSYEAFRHGEVGLVAPVISTQGAIAAVIAIASGDAITAVACLTLALIAAGVALASVPPAQVDPAAPARPGRVLPLAIIASVFFGVGLFAAGRVDSDVPAIWVPLFGRLVGFAAVGVPLALRGRLTLTRRAAPLVVVGGIAEVAGFVSFTTGARDDTAVAAVLSSQFAGIAAIVAFFLFRERLGRIQLAGAITIVVGVSLLAAVG